MEEDKCAENSLPLSSIRPLDIHYNKRKNKAIKKPRLSLLDHNDAINSTVIPPLYQQKKIALDDNNYCELMKDHYCRTLPNPRKSTVALIVNNGSGNLTAYQFFPPNCAGKEIIGESTRKTIVPEFRHIASITETERTGAVRYRCTSPGGTNYSGRTSLLLKINTPEFKNKTAELVSFIPEQSNKKVWCGSPAPLSLFKVPESNSEKKDLVKDFKEAGAHVKGGRTLDIEASSVLYRKEIKTRKPDQNTVMKESAVSAYEGFLSQYRDNLDNDVRKIIQESISAPLRDTFKNCKRTEWLHLYGFGLTPKTLNPQIKENLGAGPKWANTEMMISEYIVQWLAYQSYVQKIDGITMSIQPHFEMMLDSDIIKHIDFKTAMSYNNRHIETLQSINPFASEPYRRKCDVAFGALFISKILNGEIPDAQVHVYTKKRLIETAHSNESFTSSSSRSGSGSGSLDDFQIRELRNNDFSDSFLRKKTPYFREHKLESHFTQSFLEASLLAEERPLILKAIKESTSLRNPPSSSHQKEIPMEKPTNRDSDKSKLTYKKNKASKHSSSSSSASYVEDIASSSSISHAKLDPSLSHGIIKIEVSGFDYDYSTPYRAPEHKKWTGSGFVLNHNGEKIIVTNAHVVDDSNHIQLFSMGNHKKYSASIEYVCSEADLAIIKPKDLSFFDHTHSLTLSSKLYLAPGTEIDVKGYPIGGLELCETYGRISRIEVGEYVHRGQELLQFQVDAPINAGNSGGPVFHNNEVIGVAFQGSCYGEGLGYIIPGVVLQHFLADRLKDPMYRGFPEFPVDYQVIENPVQKLIYGLEGNLKDTGVMITRIPKLFSGKDILKKEDILVRINGKKVNSDGTIDYPWRDHVDMSHEIKMMHINDDLTLSVLRKKQLLELSMKAENRFSDTLLVRPRRYNRNPTYLVESGIVFAPVNQNNIDEVNCEIHTGRLIEESSMKDSHDEIIYISNILMCEDTEGYSSAEHNVIKRINGVDIKNMPQLVTVFDGIAVGSILELVMTDLQVLHIRKFDDEKTRKICKRNGIHKLISDDLQERNIPDYFLRDTMIPHYKHPLAFRDLFLSEGKQAALVHEWQSDSEYESGDEEQTDDHQDQSDHDEASLELESDSDQESDVSGLIASEDDHQGFSLDPSLRQQLGSIAKRQASLLWGGPQSSSSSSSSINPQNKRSRIIFEEEEEAEQVASIAARTRGKKTKY